MILTNRSVLLVAGGGDSVFPGPALVLVWKKSRRLLNFNSKSQPKLTSGKELAFQPVLGHALGA